jgi:MYXO-CTERM domain-containing protein
MRSRFASFSISLVALAALSPAPAWADPTFPGRIQTHLGLSYTPPCNVCHTSPLGFPAPASQPFAAAMQAAGLVAPDPSDTLETALDALKASGQDSDCNGTPDIQQFQEGRDPNPPGEYLDGSGRTAPTDPGCSEPVTYGCGAQLSRPSASWPGAAFLAAGLALVVVRRRKPTR